MWNLNTPREFSRKKFLKIENFGHFWWKNGKFFSSFRADPRLRTFVFVSCARSSKNVFSVYKVFGRLGLSLIYEFLVIQWSFSMRFFVGDYSCSNIYSCSKKYINLYSKKQIVYIICITKSITPNFKIMTQKFFPHQ